MKHPTREAMVGKQYGAWKVLSVGMEKNLLICKCICGTEKSVSKHNLIHGKSKSCGCINKSNRAKTHGLSKHPLYQAWKGMKARCSNPNHKNYPQYGGRGISVCDLWSRDFKAFLADVGERPSPKHTLDRIDTNGNYEPGNCRWATQKQQTRNTRRSKELTVNGVTKTVAEWAEETGILDSTIYHRIYAGWPEERILSDVRPIKKAS